MEVDTEMNGIEHAISQINIDQGDLTAMERERERSDPAKWGWMLAFHKKQLFSGLFIYGASPVAEEEAVLHEGSKQQSDEAGSCIPLDWGGKCSEDCRDLAEKMPSLGTFLHHLDQICVPQNRN